MAQHVASGRKYRTLKLGTLSVDNLLSQITSKKITEPHDHDCAEFFYVIQGSAKHILDDSSEDISVGDAFMLVPGNKHCFADQSNDFLHRDILINLRYVEKICSAYDTDTFPFLTQNGAKHITLTIDEIYSLEQSCFQLSESLSSPALSRNECIIVTTIINHLLKQSKNDVAPHWLKQLVNHLSTPEEFSHSISDIVAVYKFSVSYVCRTFKKHYGTTISKFVNMKKIEYSKILLLTTDYSIEQICEIIGFNSVSYFCKLFKKITGTTPSSVRQISHA